MFYNALKRTVQSNIRNINCYNLLRHSSGSSSRGVQDEIKDALDIEANLFENSILQHEPVNTREALRKHKPTLIGKQKNDQKKRMGAQTISSLSTKSKEVQSTKLKHCPAPLIKDSELGLEFTRLTLQNPLMTTLLTEVRSKKRRDKNKKIIIEGRRLIAEAMQSGLKMFSLFFSQKDQLALLREQVALCQQKDDAKIYKVPQHDLKTWSTLVTPPGLLALFERPSTERVQLQQQQLDNILPITVVCDNVREPNNLGSIIRTCASLPCSQVIVTHGCCDPWESKALRAGCGGQFRLPIHDDVTWDQLPLHIPPETAHDCHVFIAENNLEKPAIRTASAVDYTHLDQTGAHNVLVIGGESHGVSDEAYKFMQLVGNRGKCVYIPLAAGIDSLNVASALTLILFELRRKLSNTTNE